MFHMPTLFSDNEECRPWLQYGVCKRPQKVICKWKNIQCNKRLEGLCAALSRKRSKRWNMCGVWVPKVRKGACCKEWLFNLSDRARTRINNCKLKPEKVKQKWGSDLQQWGWFATRSIGFSLLMLPDAEHISARPFSPAYVEIEHKAFVRGCCMKFAMVGQARWPNTLSGLVIFTWKYSR